MSFELTVFALFLAAFLISWAVERASSPKTPLSRRELPPEVVAEENPDHVVVCGAPYGSAVKGDREDDEWLVYKPNGKSYRMKGPTGTEDKMDYTESCLPRGFQRELYERVRSAADKHKHIPFKVRNGYGIGRSTSMFVGPVAYNYPVPDGAYRNIFDLTNKRWMFTDHRSPNSNWQGVFCEGVDPAIEWIQTNSKQGIVIWPGLAPTLFEIVDEPECEIELARKGKPKELYVSIRGKHVIRFDNGAELTVDMRPEAVMVTLGTKGVRFHIQERK